MPGSCLCGAGFPRLCPSAGAAPQQPPTAEVSLGAQARAPWHKHRTLLLPEHLALLSGSWLLPQDSKPQQSRSVTTAAMLALAFAIATQHLGAEGFRR